MQSQETYYIEGNAAYQLNQFDHALELYSLGLKTTIGIHKEITTKLLLNRAQCGIQLRNYDITIQDCSSVLKDDPENCKALLRRAIAYENSSALSKAFEDVSAVIRLPSSVQANFLKLATKEYNRLHNLIQRDSIVMRREGRPTGMVTREQVIRLFLFEPPPIRVSFLESFSLHVCAGNEFGLWDRELMLSVESSGKAATIPIEPSFELIIPGCASDAQDESFDSFLRLELCSELSPSPQFTENGKLEIVLKIVPQEGCAQSVACLPATIPVMIKTSLVRSLPSGASVMPVITMPILLDMQSKASRLAARTVCGPSVEVECNSDLLVRVDVSSEPSWKPLLTIGAELAPSCIRQASIGAHMVMALECPGFLGIGGKVWDSTFVLLEYLNRFRNLIDGKKIVELGSGTGLAGIGLSVLDPSCVVLTDIADVVPLLQANIALNGFTSHSSIVRNCLSSHYQAEELFWGRNPSGQVMASDVIVASDVVYDPVGYEPLIETICTILNAGRVSTADELNPNLCTSGSTNDAGDGSIIRTTYKDTGNRRLCVLAHRHRHPEDAKFFSSLRSREGLTVELIPFQQEQPIASRDLLDVEIYHVYVS